MDKHGIEITPAPQGRGFRLVAEQWLPQPRDKVFAFFSDAAQLETITPPSLSFSVLSALPIAMQTGTLIDYRLRLRGIPLRWQSRIDVWEPPRRFVDVQVRGPYRHWRHEHIFEEAQGGTLCRDIVDYAAPGGWIIDRLLVRRDLLKIFAFRQQTLARLFLTAETAGSAAG